MKTAGFVTSQGSGRRKCQRKKYRSSLLIGMVISGLLGFLVSVTACERERANTQYGENVMNDSPESLLSICHQGQYVSVQELYDVCQVPGPCGQEMLCEGKIALVKGWIDYGNVFDKQHYPNLPYEKFFMRDDKQGTPLEVWTVGADNRAIFEQIYQHTHAVEKMVYIQGRLLGVDMPIMGTCHRGIKLEIDHVDSMFFK